MDAGGTLYFTLENGQVNVNLGTTLPDQLWKVQAGEPRIVLVDEFDATPDAVIAAGTRVFLKINGTIRVNDGVSEGAWVKFGGSAIDGVTEMVKVGGTLYFVGDYLGENTLFSTTGGTASLVAETESLYGTSGAFVATVNGTERIYFAAPYGGYNVLWYTAGGVAQVIRDSGDATLRDPANFILFKGMLLLSADNGVSGNEVWKATDGVSFTMSDIKSSGGSNPNNFFVYQGETGTADDVLYLSATKDDGAELFTSTDGASFTQVKDINGSGNAGPANFVEFDGAVYFAADDGTHGVELWKTDGTTGGTALVKDMYTTGDKGSLSGRLRGPRRQTLLYRR